MALKSSEIHNCSWRISTVLESPFCSSSCCQTCFPSTVRPMNRFVGMDSEDFHLFSRNEPLHLLLDVLSVSDEEDESLSSKPRTRRENVSRVQYRSNSFFPWERFLVKSRQVLFFVVLLLPLIGIQNLLHPIVTHILRAVLQEFLCRCCSVHHKLIWSMRNSDPRASIVFA